jgi:hypothetical protein
MALKTRKISFKDFAKQYAMFCLVMINIMSNN